jgi:hypothetical protein
MLTVPVALQAQFEENLRDKAVPNHLHGEYKKWLRYYWNFCGKYHFPPARKESLPRFIGKLQEKKQTDEQRRQAIKAINLYYEIVRQGAPSPQRSFPQSAPHYKHASFNEAKPSFFREVPSRQGLHQTVFQKSPQGSDPPSGKPGPSSDPGPVYPQPIKVPLKPFQLKGETGDSWEGEYTRLALRPVF